MFFLPNVRKIKKIEKIRMEMCKLAFALLLLARASAIPLIGCPPSFFSHTDVICNLWQLDPTPVNSVQTAWGYTGSFASHYSPAGARCELTIAGNSSRQYVITAKFAHIDWSSSVEFLACEAPDQCRRAFDWKGVTWNAPHFPWPASAYRFTTTAHSLKIILQVSASPTAPNTFSLDWRASTGTCDP
jgi:hypothetical protein